MASTESQIEKSLSALEAQLKLWTSRLNELTARAGFAGQQATSETRRQLDELRPKLAAAWAKLEEAKAAGSETWESVKRGIERTWDELEGAFKKLMH